MQTSKAILTKLLPVLLLIPALAQAVVPTITSATTTPGAVNSSASCVDQLPIGASQMCVITITGMNLGGATAVTIDGLAASSVTNPSGSTTQVTAIVPQDPSRVDQYVSYTVTTPGGTSNVLSNFFYGHIIFQDGFESGDYSKWSIAGCPATCSTAADEAVKAQGATLSFTPPGQSSITATCQAHSGTYGNCIIYGGLSGSNADTEITIPPTTHVFERGFVWFDPFVGTNGGGKVTYWNEQESYSPGWYMIALNPIPSGYGCGPTGPIGEWVDGAWPGFPNNHVYSSGVCITPSAWHSMEDEIQLNIPGNTSDNSGYVNQWWDGSPVLALSGLNMTGSSTHLLDKATFGNSRGPGGTSENRDWDDIAVGTALIPFGGSGTSPAALLTPSTLTFGNQAVSTTSAAQAVTLTNNGSALLSSIVVSVSGDFAQTNTCSSTLGIGSSCTINVTFTPTASGSRTGTLSVADNAPGQPQTASLSGTGAATMSAPTISSVSPSSGLANTLVTIAGTGFVDDPTIMFGSTTASASEALVTQGTPSPGLNETGTKVTSITSGTFPQIAGQSLIVFGRHGTDFSSTITITDHAGDTFTPIPCTGPGTCAGALTISSPNVGAAEAFYVLSTNADAANTVTATFNNPVAYVEVFPLQGPSGVTALDTHKENTDGGTAGNACLGSAFNTAQANEWVIGFCTIDDFATAFTAGPSITNPYTYSQQVNPVPNATSAVEDLALWSTATGLSASQTFSRRSGGPGSWIGLTEAFKLSAAPALTIAAPAGTGGPMNVVVTNPDTGAATCSNCWTYSSSGTVTMSLSPASLSYSNQVVGTSSSTQTVTVTNTSASAALTFAGSSISVTGANSGDFGQTNTCISGSPIAAGLTCTITVTFTPQAIGSRVATLNLVDNAVNSPQSVPLSGTGVAPAVSLSASSYFWNGVQVGQSVQGTPPVMLTNIGTSTLNISSIATTGVNSGDFSFTTVPSSTCGSTVAPGGTCAIYLTFTPSAVGVRTATLVISDDASTSPQMVSLQGNGNTTFSMMAGSGSSIPACAGFIPQPCSPTHTALTVDTNGNGSNGLYGSSLDGSTGLSQMTVNTPVIDPFFGARMTRVTNASSGSGHSYTTTDAGWPKNFNCAGTPRCSSSTYQMFTVQDGTNGGNGQVFAINPSSMNLSRVDATTYNGANTTFNVMVNWSGVDANRMFAAAPFSNETPAHAMTYSYYEWTPASPGPQSPTTLLVLNAGPNGSSVDTGMPHGAAMLNGLLTTVGLAAIVAPTVQASSCGVTPNCIQVSTTGGSLTGTVRFSITEDGPDAATLLHEQNSQGCSACFTSFTFTAGTGSIVAVNPPTKITSPVTAVNWHLYTSTTSNTNLALQQCQNVYSGSGCSFPITSLTTSLGATHHMNFSCEANQAQAADCFMHQAVVSNDDTRFVFQTGGISQDIDMIALVWDTTFGARWIDMSTSLIHNGVTDALGVACGLGGNCWTAPTGSITRHVDPNDSSLGASYAGGLHEIWATLDGGWAMPQPNQTVSATESYWNCNINTTDVYVTSTLSTASNTAGHNAVGYALQVTAASSTTTNAVGNTTHINSTSTSLPNQAFPGVAGALNVYAYGNAGTCAVTPPPICTVGPPSKFSTGVNYPFFGLTRQNVHYSMNEEPLGDPFPFLAVTYIQGQTYMLSNAAASASRSGEITTYNICTSGCTSPNGFMMFFPGDEVTVSGMADASFNGSFIVSSVPWTTTGSTSFLVTQPGPNGTTQPSSSNSGSVTKTDLRPATAWENEVYLQSHDGSGQTWRFAHGAFGKFGSGTVTGLNGQISQDGHFAIISDYDPVANRTDPVVISLQ